jgi:hypothetical protein
VVETLNMEEVIDFGGNDRTLMMGGLCKDKLLKVAIGSSRRGLANPPREWADPFEFVMQSVGAQRQCGYKFVGTAVQGPVDRVEGRRYEFSVGLSRLFTGRGGAVKWVENSGNIQPCGRSYCYNRISCDRWYVQFHR